MAECMTPYAKISIEGGNVWPYAMIGIEGKMYDTICYEQHRGWNVPYATISIEGKMYDTICDEQHGG
jgi:hypothetical protein